MATSRNKTYSKIIFAITLLVLAFAPLSEDRAKAALNNSRVISDYNFNNSNPMSAAEINSFLATKGSRLADYTIPENIEVPYPLAAGGFGTVTSRQINDVNGAPFYGKTAAQLIYDESVEHNINPRVILATLEKESSAVSGNVFRSSTVGAWPMFYMYDETMADCLNSGTNCNDSAYRQRSLDYGGIGRQLGYAIGWFGKKYYDYTHDGRCLGWNGVSCTLGYEQYTDPVTIDGQSIISQTIGTRALYLYTPHIQTSFYNIFSSFFGDPTLDGTPPVSNDTRTFSDHTYARAIRIEGYKTTTAKAYFLNRLIADLNDGTAWGTDYVLEFGLNEGAIIYKDAAEAEITRKTFQVYRHKQGDINGDGTIDITDLAVFAENWNKGTLTDAMADQNADGKVDIDDLAIFAENWGK